MRRLLISKSLLISTDFNCEFIHAILVVAATAHV